MSTPLTKIIVVVFALIAATVGFADSATTIRATQLTSKIVNDLQNGTVQDLIIDFRQGDRLPLTFLAEGDLLETNQVTPSYVVVKRPFWMRMTKNSVMMSLDGLNYKNIRDVVTGSITASASDQGTESGTANMISVLFKAFLK
jgi:hypothetical protein